MVQELEIQIKQYGISEVTVNPQDYISRNEHARICDSRVSARDSELQVGIRHVHLSALIMAQVVARLADACNVAC